jgi:membrane protease YdiL (CAAX protease family)
MKVKLYIQCITFAVAIFAFSYVFSGICYRIFGIQRFSDSVLRYVSLSLTVMVISLILFTIKKEWIKSIVKSLHIRKGIVVMSACIFLFTIVSISFIAGLLTTFDSLEYKGFVFVNFTNTCKILCLSFFIAVTEEILFRGYILNFCKNIIGNKSSIVLVSIIFALSHFNNHTLAAYIISFLGSVVFSLLTLKTNSLYPAITFHWVWNFSQMVVSNLFIKRQFIPFFGQVFDLAQVLFLVVVIILLAFVVNAKKPICPFSRPK